MGSFKVHLFICFGSLFIFFQEPAGAINLGMARGLGDVTDNCASQKEYELTVCRRIETPSSNEACQMDDQGNVISGNCKKEYNFVNPAECQSVRETLARECERPRERPPVETEYSARDDGEEIGDGVVLPENPGVIPIERPQQGGKPPAENGQQAAAPSEGGYTAQDLLNDINSCNMDSQQAFKCCNSPEKCGAPSRSSSYSAPPTNDPAGMKRYCEQMKYASLSNERTNDKAAGVCYSNHTACSANCKQSKEKWESYLPNCKPPNCDPNKVNEALSIFNRKVSECMGLEKNEQMLARQSDSSYSAAQQAYQCEQQAKQDPSTMPENSNQDKADTASLGPDCSGENATKPECVDCSKYPNSPLCGGGKNTGGGDDSQFGSVKKTPGDGISFSDFNPNTNADGLPQFPQFESVQPQQAQGHAIQNGGGSMLGGGGSGGGAFGGEDGGGAAASGYNTDVLPEGTTGGGGYSAAPASAGGSGGGFGGYGSGGNNTFDNRYRPLDLKQYLPGGKKDPARKVASKDGPSTGHPEIAPMGKSMFKMISDRFTKMCKDKQLIGCE